MLANVIGTTGLANSGRLQVIMQKVRAFGAKGRYIYSI